MTCDWARTSAARRPAIEVGASDLPEAAGRETGAALTWRLDTQDSPVIPTGGVLAQVQLLQVFDSPDCRSGAGPRALRILHAVLASANAFRRAGTAGRLFAFGSVGSSLRWRSDADFDLHPRVAVPAGGLLARRDSRRARVDRRRRVSAPVHPPAGLPGRARLCGCMARERRCLRRMVVGAMANQCQRRPGHGHADRSGCHRRQLGLRWPMAHLFRRRPCVPLSEGPPHP